jgi:hypothetical protein
MVLQFTFEKNFFGSSQIITKKIKMPWKPMGGGGALISLE